MKMSFSVNDLKKDAWTRCAIRLAFSSQVQELSRLTCSTSWTSFRKGLTLASATDNCDILKQSNLESDITERPKFGRLVN